MHNAIEKMLNNYSCGSLTEYTHAVKEILQQIALLGLWRSKFFEKGAFYGGTALRILYGLPRFSEDLDFSLLQPQDDFNLQIYNEAIIAEMESFGFKVSIEAKEKNRPSRIHAATLKADTVLQLINIAAPAKIIEPIHKDQKLKIKMEIDIDPPLRFQIEDKYILQPIPFSVNAFSLPDLFASKIHVALCRTWKTRGVKGRDWFDLTWYVGQKVPVNLLHLKERLIHSHDLERDKPFEAKDMKQLLEQKLANIDIEQARQDVLPFIKDKESLSVWSKNFFHHIIEQICTVT